MFILKQEEIDLIFKRILKSYKKRYPDDDEGINFINGIYIQILTIKNVNAKLFQRNIYKIICRFSRVNYSEKVAEIEEEQ